MNGEDKKQRQDLYAETRRDLLMRQLSNSERFDGAILTLSTGVLAVSLAFIKDVVELDEAQGIVWLTISWWLFGGAIISTLSSFVTSQWGIERQLQCAKEYYLNEKEEFLEKKNIAASVTLFLNHISAVLFIVAMASTIIFVSGNL